METEKKRRRGTIRPKTAIGLVRALNHKKLIDERTRTGKIIREVKTAVRHDLEETARALLESDVANAAAVQDMALRQALSAPSGIVDGAGKPHHALVTWMKFANLKKSSLLALRKFQPKIDKEDGKGLKDLILEVNEEGEGP